VIRNLSKWSHKRSTNMAYCTRPTASIVCSPNYRSFSLSLSLCLPTLHPTSSLKFLSAPLDDRQQLLHRISYSRNELQVFAAVWIMKVCTDWKLHQLLNMFLIIYTTAIVVWVRSEFNSTFHNTINWNNIIKHESEISMLVNSISYVTED
jgi:hypothetical protein